MPALVTAAALAATAPVVLAQTETTAATETTTPHVLVDTVGPDGWRIRFGPTNLGSLLESEQGRELWQPVVDPMLAAWAELTADETEFDALRTRLLSYGGRIRIGAWIGDEHRMGRDEPAATIAFVLYPDGRSDLAAIGEDLRETLYQSIPGDWREVQVDDTTVTARNGAEFLVSEPRLENGRLVVAASSTDDLALAFTRARSLAVDLGEPLRPDSPALTARIDFAQLIATAIANEPGSDGAIMKALGLTTVDVGKITLGTAGPRVLLEYAQQFTQDDRGLFSAFLPATQTVPILLQAVGEGSWTVGHFDCGKLYDCVLEAVAAAMAPDDEDLAADIKESLGVDPATDLLAHMTDEVMLWLPEPDSYDDGIDRTPWALTFRLKDDGAFAKGLFKMLPQARPFLQRERSEQHEDVELFRYGNMIGYDLWLAAGRGVFTIAGGRGAEDRLAEVLDRCKNLPAELAADQQRPADFATLARHLPPGCHGYAKGSATNIVSLPTSLWFELLQEVLPIPIPRPSLDPDEDAERREELDELLQAHRLDVARSATGYADRTWRLRFFW